jgi:hypothetical protein
MKKRRKKTSHQFKITAYPHTSWEALLNLEPEKFAVYIRRAEKLALPTIMEKRLSPAAAQLVLSQHAQVLATSDSRMTDESMLAVSNHVLKLWQAGYYTPGPDYPFTFEETLQELREGAKPKEDYTASIQPYTPIGNDIPRSTREVAGGIVKHPETNLWQIWMMDDGPWESLGAYRDPGKAQHYLEVIINTIRQGTTITKGQALYRQLLSDADGEAKELPYDMLLYLAEHHERFMIKL